MRSSGLRATVSRKARNNAEASRVVTEDFPEVLILTQCVPVQIKRLLDPPGETSMFDQHLVAVQHRRVGRTSSWGEHRCGAEPLFVDTGHHEIQSQLTTDD